jgi:hypothetical protein
METEKLAYQWLQKTYEKEAIVFTHGSPDFRTSDGKGWEVKPSRNKVVVFGKNQVERLRQFAVESQEPCFVLIYDMPRTAEESIEPTIIVPLIELEIPGYWREYRLYAPPTTTVDMNIEKRIQQRLEARKNLGLPTSQTLVKELVEAETRLVAADNELKDSEIRKAVALATFITTRKLFKQEYGFSPYAQRAGNIYPQDSKQGRGFRFSGMKIDEAILEILQDHESLTLPILIQTLNSGGLTIRDEQRVFIEPFIRLGIRVEGNKLTHVTTKTTKEENHDPTGNTRIVEDHVGRDR